MQRGPTHEEIRDIARNAIVVFERHGLACCLTGGTASALYGTTRTPNDVDLVVLTAAYGQETLKRMLVMADPDFYTLAAKDLNAAYRVLWCKVPTRYTYGRERRCKVDVLIPGVMNIPDVPRDRISRISGLPVMPLDLLFFLKLQSWTDHRDSPQYWKVSKQYDDSRDIEELLLILKKRGVSIRRSGVAWLSEAFVAAGRGRMAQYVRAYPSSRTKWEELGLRFK
ncbi:uncharacterized protein LAESUDRAFT_649487 [Laetiporus sulphureus 93-53]|uniref:Nucleotidyltransferase n=1 Tax=Laetiporus sulphureus 93-53 TaxID=1314785 RepID=A0A165F2D3_9APHY|nr:uncharacterized protein LAESUDRAFT_649487 [Laetiporus sulphureus 93-53]KZT08228.1 hypothetical protein LAESUDRAFT_649487 [Laetiporus sulphureus 93-53]